jgi:hypothetical protein
MSVGGERWTWRDWVGVLLPSGVVLLSLLFQRWMPWPTSAGLSFLVVMLVAVFLFPTAKLSAVKIVVGLFIALLIAVVVGVFVPAHK